VGFVVVNLLPWRSQAASEWMAPTPATAAAAVLEDKAVRVFSQDVLILQRDLQSSSLSSAATYWVNYTAEFQVVQDTFCVAPTPVIRLYCDDNGVLVVHNTSDPSIVCGGNRVDEQGFSYVECTNSCADSDCSVIYLNVDLDIDKGPLGRIDFSCSGSSLTSVGGVMQLVESTELGSCAATSSRTVTRIYNVARLGVSCPPLNDETGKMAMGNSADSTNRSIVYDDYYFECIPYQRAYPFSDTDNAYMCFMGDNCAGVACNVNLTSLLVEANVPNFQDTCVQTTLSSSIPERTVAPVTDAQVAADIVYTARFEAAWALQFTPRTDTTCTGFVPTALMYCWHGTARFVSSVYDAMNCTTLDDDPTTLICTTDTNRVGINDFVSVIYVSNGTDGRVVVCNGPGASHT
jgi:hypothetical protein